MAGRGENNGKSAGFWVEIEPVAGGKARHAAIMAAVEKAVHDKVEKVRQRGNQMILSGPHTGRKYGAHQASAPNEPAAAGGGDGILAQRSKVVDKVEGDVVISKAVWDAPHAHLMEKGFMHKPHRPKETGRRRKKKWGDEVPTGSVYVAPRPFARPAGLEMLAETRAALNDAAKSAAGGAKGPK